MTIKEIEVLTGMSRANIRFYEKEGLLAPTRNENGYRVYSQDDVQTLKRIKLLRLMHISLDEIKRMHQGEEKLSSVLNRHIESLREKEEDVERCRRMCREMLDDETDYQRLKVQRYAYFSDISTETERAVLTADMIPKVRAPWRRYFARSLDFVMYDCLWKMVLSKILHLNILQRGYLGEALDIVVITVMMLLIEPVLLALFGTTLGKKVMGLRVTDSEDRKLSLKNAFLRTYLVLLKGMGLNIPLYTAIRSMECYGACSRGETLEWEKDSFLHLRDSKKWRFAVFAAVQLLVVGVLLLTFITGGRPLYSGDITKAQFCENYNHIAFYHAGELGVELDAEGNWVESEKTSGTDYWHISHSLFHPDFTITETDGAVTEVELAFEDTGNIAAWVPSFQDQMIFSVKAFPWAEEDDGMFFSTKKELIDKIETHGFESFQFSKGGVNAVCEIKYKGYDKDEGDVTIYPKEDVKSTSYSFCFRISK